MPAQPKVTRRGGTRTGAGGGSAVWLSARLSEVRTADTGL